MKNSGLQVPLKKNQKNNTFSLAKRSNGYSTKKIQGYIVPMLTTAVDKPFLNKEWVFELKLDGYRAISEITSHGILFYSRNGLSFKERFPSIAAALKKIKHKAVLDGEVVLLNEHNRPDFQKLQHYESNRNLPLVYYVFDLISFDGKDLKHHTLLERKKLLKNLLGKNKVLRYCDHIEEEGIAFFKSVMKENMEGIIAKKADSYYTPAIRSREWLKIKNQQTQEAIIAGYTAPKGSRKYFGSLLLGQYRRNKLGYIGHAGTGFTESSLKDLMKKMQTYITDKSPFPEKIRANAPVTWLKPELVCEVSYTEITRDGMLRHPVYKGLRPEKRGKNIRSETETPKPVKTVIKKINPVV